MNKNKFYVTTPLYYVNSKPHLGTLYSTLLADVAARWNKFLGKKVFFLTGTDEHGQKIAEKAKQEGLAPKEFVDSMIPKFKETWKLYEIEYDKFIRTTDKEHEDAVVKWINKLEGNGDIYKSSYTGWYCVPCETFVSLEDDAEIVCPTCRRELKKISEENYFFRLSAYEDRLLKFYEENPNFVIPKGRLNEVISFVKSGLKDLSISRKGLKWGITYPGDDDHSIYVWADALNNYISAIGYGSDDVKKQEEFKFLWPADLQIMAKDILRFHAVYWPAFLMAANIPLPLRVYGHGWILSGDEKMSKSKGNILDPLEIIKTYGLDPLRYYLIKEVSFGNDGNISKEKLENCINSDLANNFGNLCQRVTAFAQKNCSAKVPKIIKFNKEDLEMLNKFTNNLENIRNEIDKQNVNFYIDFIVNALFEANKYFNDQEPWKKKEDLDRLNTIVYTSLEMIRKISFMLYPIIPQTINKVLKIFNLDSNAISLESIASHDKLRSGEPINKIDILFKKIEKNND